MSNLVTVIDADLPFKGVSIDRMKLIPSVGDSEFFASAHWLFGQTGNMLDLKAGKPLTRQMIATVTNGGSGYTSATVSASDGSTWVTAVSAGAVTAIKCTAHTLGTGTPTLTISGDGTGATATVARGLAATQNASSITIQAKSDKGNGLIVPGINDSATQTLCAVFKKGADSGAAQLVFGTADGSVPNAGSLLWKSVASGAVFARARGIDSASVSLGTPGSAGDWVFAGVSYKPTTGRQYRLSGSLTGSTAGTKTPNNVEIALGNAWCTGFSMVAMEVAEFITFPLALTYTEMLAVYNRSKARLAALAAPITVA